MTKYENNVINYILLTLTCLNFMGRGSLIFLIFCLYNFFLVDKYLERRWIILIFMSISMLISIVAYSEEVRNESIKVLNYALPFIIGYGGYEKATDKIVYIKRTLFFLFLGYSLQIALIYLYNLSLGTTGRVLISIWTHERATVTLIGLLSSFVIGYSLAVLIFVDSKIHKLISLAGLVFVILINMQTATRTPFMMILLVSSFLLLVLLFSSGQNKKSKYFLLFLVIVLLLYLAFNFNWFGLRDMVLSSPIFDRFETSGIETSRIEIMKVYFNNMLKYPLGGSNVYQSYGRLPHNIWQQCYDDYGFIAAFLMICITVSFISQLFKLIRFKDKQPMDYILISVYLSSTVQLALEPALTGYPILLWTLIFIHGITCRYYGDKINSTDMTDSMNKSGEFR